MDKKSIATIVLSVVLGVVGAIVGIDLRKQPEICPQCPPCQINAAPALAPSPEVKALAAPK